MSALVGCPELECWQALFDEAVAPAQREAYEQHLESCRACQERLHRAEDNRDGLLPLVRRLADAANEPQDPTLDCLLERLRGVQSALHPLEPAEITFLRPADRPGLLGTLGAYEVLEVIGQGGMGIVLKAHEPALQRLVAVKVMAPWLAGSRNARRRFTREARSAAAVSHDHVVKVHGVWEESGVPYLVMEYVAGESLQSRLDRTGPLAVAEIVGIGLQTALGLAAAHARGLIHRDVKPANILSAACGLAARAKPQAAVVKITDFGLARAVDDVALTQNGVIAGTPEYMAPEQARGEAVDPRTDLFSLGSVLYALCTGVPPFHGSSALAVLRQVSDEEPVSIRALNPGVPQWLANLIVRLMAKAPADRFQSAAEVAAVLERGLAQPREMATVGPPERGPVTRLVKRFPPGRWLAAGFLVLTVLVLVPAALRFRSPPLPAAMPEGPAAAPARAGAADGKKDQPAGDARQADAPAKGPAPQEGGPATPEQERAVAILKRLHAKFRFDATGRSIVHVVVEPGTAVDEVLEELLPLTEIDNLSLQGTQITDASLKHVAGFKKMRQLYLGQTAITDAGLKELAPCGSLTHLGLENTHISDTGIKYLVSLKNLHYLNIGGTAVTDGCLKDVGGFDELGMLCLYSTEVTDAGMKELKGLTSLRTLLLNDTALTDAGIRELAPLKQLRKIDVQNTRITDAGLKALKDTAPAARVEADSGAAPGGEPGHYRGWLTAAVVFAAVVALIAAGGRFVVRKRRTGGKARPSAGTLPITLCCPGCQRKLQAKPALAGKAVKCPGCGSAVRVPSLASEAPPDNPV